jgi:ABC-type uncharacterized transport system involved in gliding motility auxiliary subunit
MKKLTHRANALAAVVLAAVLFFAVNIVSNLWLGSAQLDLTENGLFTVSPGTRAVLSKLPEPVTLRYYFSRQPAAGYASIVAYSNRVRDLLKEYASLAGGKLVLEEIDPAPFTPAEDDAVAQGLTAAPTQTGDNVYFGLVGTNSIAGHEVVPFFDQNREQYLEYDLTSLIYRLSNPKKPKLGVLTALPLETGAGGLQAALQGNSQPYVIYQQLRDTFDVQMLDANVDRIPADISTLFIAHPSGFSPQAQYAIDQFVLRGGHAIVFVDPLSEAMSAGNQGGPGDPNDKSSSSLPALFRAWGIDYDPTKVVTDAELAQQVQVGGAGGAPQVVDYIAWLRATPANFATNDPVTGNLQQLNIATAGTIKASQGATTHFTPLVSSSSNAALVDATVVRMTQNPRDLIRRFEGTGAKYTIAARVDGPAKTAFPNGAPAAAAPATPDAAKPAPLPDQIKEAANVNLIVVADTDMLDDRFWVQVQNVLGQRIAIPGADNGALVVNSIENMMGSNDLISLRTRERSDRPFVVVDRIRRDAEGRFLAQEQALQQRVTETQASLRALQGQGNPDEPTQGPPVLTKEQQAQIEKFRADLVTARANLRQVQANLRADVENLGTVLAVLNIALVPALISLAAIGLALLRSRRRARARGL